MFYDSTNNLSKGSDKKNNLKFLLLFFLTLKLFCSFATNQLISFTLMFI